VLEIYGGVPLLSKGGGNNRIGAVAAYDLSFPVMYLKKLGRTSVSTTGSGTYQVDTPFI